MAEGVYYTDLGIELNLTEDDLGHPEHPGLWQRLLAEPHFDPGRFRCLDPDPQHDCPKVMYVYERQGKRLAGHHNPGQRTLTAEESDLHKATKERIARAAEHAGFHAEPEDRAKHGKRRTDVLIHGANGFLLGCEVQVSRIEAATVDRRTRIAQSDGITPLWTAEDDRHPLIHRAPWTLLRRMHWHDIATANRIPILGGVRTLRLEQCRRRGTVCPDGVVGGCNNWHADWEAAQAPHLDDLIIRAAAQEMVPLELPGRQTRYFWVPGPDRDTYLQNLHETKQPAQLAARGRATGEVEPKELSYDCTYGIDAGIRSTPFGPRDDNAPVLAFSVPATRAPAHDQIGNAVNTPANDTCQCGQSLWAPVSRRRGYCERCRIARGEPAEPFDWKAVTQRRPTR